MVKVKICGLRRDEDIDYVNELKPDYIGFILSKGYRRSIDIDTARRLKKRLDPSIKAVGVFVNEDLNYIEQYDFIDLVQLHGTESADYCRMIDMPVIKVFKPDSFDKVNEYVCEYYLFDSGTGTGKTFDWSLIPDVDHPFFLAGGLNEDNLKEAIETIKPYGIDLSSAVETDGYKDYDKIKRILEIVRNE